VTPQPDPLTEKGPIPYFSHGIGVDQELASRTPGQLTAR
jgi:hypothetical protein